VCKITAWRIQGQRREKKKALLALIFIAGKYILLFTWNLLL